MPRIAIDLTPLLPGGENGGAKLLILELLSQFKKLSHDFDFLLLTAYWNHEDLAIFDGPKFQRLCVFHAPPSSNQPKTIANPIFFDRIKNQLRQAKLLRSIPLLLPLSRLLKRIWSKFLNPSLSPIVPKNLLQGQGVSLLFCPFTKPNYAEPDIPIVSIFYDLQHRTYPQFFLPLERERRDATLTQLGQRVESIVCISEFSRRTLLEELKIAADRTQTIPVCIQSRLFKTKSGLSILETLNLNNRPYFFYPANFWPHKNHKMLITAYDILFHRNPGFELDLVFTGALNQPEQELRTIVEEIGLKNRIHFLGFLSDEELAAVFQGCRFMIFPSLYEGFGIPLLEAFSFGKPVLCSNVGSLPEIGGNAAYYFDPDKPLDIVEAIERFLTDPDLSTKLVKEGYKQVAKFQREEMAQAYLEVFNRTLAQVSFYKRV